MANAEYFEKVLVGKKITGVTIEDRMIFIEIDNGEAITITEDEVEYDGMLFDFEG